MREAFIDGSFAPAKQSVTQSPRSWKSQTLLAFLSAFLWKAPNIMKQNLWKKTIGTSYTPYAPEKLIGDKAFDSDPLDQKLIEERRIEMIAPHRTGRKKFRTQDGRKLRS